MFPINFIVVIFKSIQVFERLEECGHRTVLISLLNKITWKKEKDVNIDGVVIAGLGSMKLRWIFLEVAVGSFVKHNFIEGCFDLLKDCAAWARPRNISSGTY